MSVGKFGSSLKNFFNTLTVRRSILIIIVIGMALFLNSLFNDFVWDDSDLISNINSSDSLRNFYFGFGNTGRTPNGYEVYYKPLFFTVLFVLRGLFGNTAFFYHLFQLMLHIANACLVFIILKRFLGKNLSLALSLVFLVHPINTEAVIYTAALQEPLFFFFGMMAFVTLATDKLNENRLALGGLLMLLSLLSKPTGGLFLFAICIFHLLYKKSTALKVIYSTTSALGIYLVMSFLIAKTSLGKLAYVPIMRASLAERFQNMPAVFFHYIKTFFYPKVLAVSQHWLVKSSNFNTFYLPLMLDTLFLLLVLTLGIYIWKFRKNSFKPYLFFSIWFFLGMGLHLQIIPLDMTVAERWFYFPIVGMLGMIGVFMSSLKFKNYKTVAVVSFMTVVSVLSIRTFIRNLNWKNPLTLYAHDIVYNDTSYDLESNLGTELFRVGKKDEAKKHFERSVSLSPQHWINWANLAGYYYDAGDYTSAEKYYNLSLQNNSFFLGAHVNYARLLLFHDESNGQKAKVFLEESVRVFPQNAQLWLYLAIANYQQGLTNEALIAARRSYELIPNKESQYVYFRLQQNLPLNIEIK